MKNKKIIAGSLVFLTGDSFTLGSHSGFTDYGQNFFAKKTTLDDGAKFRYGVKFLSVTTEEATFEITRFAE